MKKRDKLGRPTVPNTPSSDKFWTQSKAFLDAAKASHDVMREPNYYGEICIPITFLYFRAMELALKACLPLEKLSDQDVRNKYGHKLSLLIDELERTGVFKKLGMKKFDFKMIEDFSEDYSNKWFEYGHDYTNLPEDLDHLSELVTKFISNTKQYGI